MGKKAKIDNITPSDYKEDRFIRWLDFLHIPESITSFLRRDLWEEVDGSGLAFVRFAWGLIMAYESGKLIAVIRPMRALEFSFKYYGFAWVSVLPKPLMEIEGLLMLMFAIFISLGLFYRTSAILFFIFFTHFFLLEMSVYLNHLYLACLINFLLIFMPLGHCYSLDAWRRRGSRVTVPFWCIWMLRALILIVYFYAGISKINEDWLRGEPMHHWIVLRTRDRPLNQMLALIPHAGILLSYAGLITDLFISPSLLFRKTRVFAVVILIGFHAMNHFMFNIGIFPFMMVFTMPVFFDPGWLRQLLRMDPLKNSLPTTTNRNKRWIMVFIVLFLSYHVIMPLRYLAYPGNVSWTEHGHLFSWQMMLRDKKSHSVFYLHDPLINNGSGIEIIPEKILVQRQLQRMECRPDMIAMFCREIRDRYKAQTGRRPKITVDYACSMNYRPFQRLIDPDYNMGIARSWRWPMPWLIPLLPRDVKKSEHLMKHIKIEHYRNKDDELDVL